MKSRVSDATIHSAVAAPDARLLWHAAAVFAVALGVRALHDWQIRAAPMFNVLMGDAQAYDDWARRIASGEWIGRDVFYQAPLYPYFLAVLYRIAGHDLAVVRVCQALLGSLACVLLAIAGRRLFSERTGLAAGLLLAVYPPAIFFDGILQKSALDGFLICVAIWLVSGLARDQKRDTLGWASLGVTAGALGLTRENALVLVVVLLAWMAAQVRHDPKTRVSTVAAFLTGLAIVLLPVAFRNYSVSGSFYLTTAQSGPNFYIGNNPKALGTYMPLREGRGAVEYERQDATDLAEQAVGRRLTPAEVSAYWSGRAFEFIRREPAAWLGLLGRKTLLILNAGESADTESLESYAEWSMPLRLGSPILHFGILLPLAVIGVWATWPQRRRLWVVHAMAVTYAASVVLFYVSARYRYPLVPFAILFAAAGLAALPRLVRGTRARNATQTPVGTRALVFGLATTVAVLTNWPLVSVEAARAVTEYNLGVALQSQGRLDEAMAHYRQASNIRPDWAPPYDKMGTVFFAQGHADEAIAQYERALSLGPALTSAHLDLGIALLARGRSREAIEHFRRALRDAPDQAEAHLFLGTALEADQQWSEAIDEFRETLRLNPQSGNANRNIGSVLARTGAKEDAAAYFRKAVELNPNDGQAQLDLASLLLDAKRYDEAMGPLREAIRLSPASAEAHNSLGIALASRGRLDEAIAQFNEVLTLNPGDQRARQNLATAMAQRNAGH